MLVIMQRLSRNNENANQSWRQMKGDRPFGATHHERTPKEWATPFLASSSS